MILAGLSQSRDTRRKLVNMPVMWIYLKRVSLRGCRSLISVSYDSTDTRESLPRRWLDRIHGPSPVCAGIIFATPEREVVRVLPRASRKSRLYVRGRHCSRVDIFRAALACVPLCAARSSHHRHRRESGEMKGLPSSRPEGWPRVDSRSVVPISRFRTSRFANHIFMYYL